jgi:prephenate dehydrogenase
MTISTELSADQAAALAQLCKRWRHDIARSISVDDTEADQMMAAVDALRAALADSGYSPR